MLLDSNILILYLNGDTEIITMINTLHNSGRALFISATSITEVRSLSSLTQTELKKIDKFLDQFITIPIEVEIAKAAGDLRRTKKLTFADAIIVATAAIQNVPLATRDKELHRITSVQFVDL